MSVIAFLKHKKKYNPRWKSSSIQEVGDHAGQDQQDQPA